MIAFPSLLVAPCRKFGIKTPPNSDYGFDATIYPHFAVFCNIQLARPMVSSTEHWHNAEVIAKISEGEIKSITLEQLISRGVLCVI